MRAILYERPNVTLKDITRVMGVERHTVERACRNEGTTFLLLRQEHRFHHARAALAGAGCRSIKEIASEIGYSGRAFTRFVRAASGMTPTQFRHLLQNGDASTSVLKFSNKTSKNT